MKSDKLAIVGWIAILICLISGYLLLRQVSQSPSPAIELNIEEIKRIAYGAPRGGITFTREEGVIFPIEVHVSEDVRKEIEKIKTGKEFEEMAKRVIYLIENAECSSVGASSVYEPPSVVITIECKNKKKIIMESRGGDTWRINGNMCGIENLSSELDPMEYGRKLLDKLFHKLKDIGGNATIITNKKEYKLGEPIIAVVNYSGVIYKSSDPTYKSILSWSIQKLENGSWIDIQTKAYPSFKEISPFTCYKVPDCKEINLEKIDRCPPIFRCPPTAWEIVKSNLKLVWNQTYKVKEKRFLCKVGEKIINRTCFVFAQAPPGRYKIRFEYRIPGKSEPLYAEKEIIISE